MGYTTNIDANIWIAIALDDLKSAQILYQNKCYRNSYVLFQQASEKASKALAIYLFTWNEKVLRKEISHNATKIYEKFFAEHKGNVQVISQQLLGIFPQVSHYRQAKRFLSNHHSKDIDAGQDFLDEKKKQKWQSSEILNLLDGLHEAEQEVKNWLKPSTPEFKETVKRYVEWSSAKKLPHASIFKTIYDKCFDGGENEKQFYEVLDIVFEIAKTTTPFVGVLAVCTYFATYDFSPRYPEKGNNPLQIYTKSFPIIKHQEEIMAVLSKALLKFRKFIVTNPNNKV